MTKDDLQIVLNICGFFMGGFVAYILVFLIVSITKAIPNDKVATLSDLLAVKKVDKKSPTEN